MEWNPTLANDDDIFWITHVALQTDGGATGATEYLAKFQNGKHAAEAKSILNRKGRGGTTGNGERSTRSRAGG